jgi:hypothetical protein
MGGRLEDLGAILGVLGVMVSTIRKPLKNRLDSFIQNSKIIENGWDTAIIVFGFRSTFNEGSVLLDYSGNLGQLSPGDPLPYLLPRLELDSPLFYLERPKGLIRPLKALRGLIRPFKGLIRSIEGLIRPLRAIWMCFFWGGGWRSKNGVPKH